MKRILITGHRGFVGRAYMRFLDPKEHEITGIDIKPGLLPNEVNLKSALIGDCRDFFRSHDTPNEFDLVIHLAAIVGGRETIEGQPLAVASDLAIDADFWQWVIRTRPGRVVYFSSSAAYPIELQQRNSGRELAESDININDKQEPDLTYGFVKLAGEYQAHFVQQMGIPIHIFRPFSGYGADQGVEYPYGRFLQRIRDREDPFEIFGDGTQTRDFIHIEDVVRLSMVAVERNVTQPLNLGTGRPTNFNELADLMLRAVDWRPKEVKHLLGKPVGVHYRVANPSKMVELVGAPQITLEDAVRRDIAATKDQT